MEQPAASSGAGAPASPPAAADQDRVFAAIVASIERLDELGLCTERGVVAVEPASAFHWL